MSIKTIVRNYQRIKEAKINIDGITVVRGESNSGKSSYFKAIYAGTHNRFRAGCIKFGEEAIEVKIQDPEKGLVLSVVRRATGSPRITLSDPKDPGSRQSWSKLNRDMPNEVIDYLNFGTINVSTSEKYSLNFFPQSKPPLLYDYSQQKIMDILSASKAVDDLNKVRKEIDIRRVKNSGAFESLDSVLTQIKVELAQTQVHLEEYKDLDKIEVKVNSLISLRERIQSLQNLKTLLAEQDKLQQLVNNYETLIEFTTKKALINARSKELIILTMTMNRCRFLTKSLVDIKKGIDLLTEKSRVSLRISQLKELRSTIKSSIKLAHYIESMSVVYTEYFMVKDNSKVYKEKQHNLFIMKEALNKVNSLSSRLKYLQDLYPIVCSYHDKLQIQQDLKIRKLSINQVLTQKKFCEGLGQTVEDLKNIVNNNLCPLCHSPLDKEHSHV